MKIAIFGNTLYAGVMSVLLSESGHQVFWCSDTQNNQNNLQYAFHDENVNQLLEKQLKSGFLNYAALSELPLDIDGYVFSFNQTQEIFVFHSTWFRNLEFNLDYNRLLFRGKLGTSGSLCTDS